MATPSVDDQFEVLIESLSSLGPGVCHVQGIVCFVPYSCPGDRLKIKITEVKGRFLRGEILEILRPGPSRITPPCPVFQRCGGCHWQHVSYPEQVLQKQLILKSTFEKSKSAFANILEPIPSPLLFRYRNRIQVQVQNSKVGFLKRKSHEFVEINDCLIAEERLIEELPRYSNREPGRYEISSKEVFEPDQEPAGYFRQVNSSANDKLLEKVLELLNSNPTENLLDLYCGNGNLSQLFALNSPKTKIFAVDLDSTSVEAGFKAAQKKGLRNYKFYSQDVGIFLKRFLRPKGTLTVLLDPPRGGCEPNTLTGILDLRPDNIIYVSCNPTTLDRDLQLFKAQYDFLSVQLLDMFPQTFHFECITFLRRKGALAT